MCGVLFWGIGGWMGGTRSRCFNSGYHDLGAVISELSLVVYVHMSKWANILMLRICYSCIRLYV